MTTAHPLDRLEARPRAPRAVRNLETWIQQAERRVGVGAARLGWMVASSVVIAALQRVAHDDGRPRFLIKGGAYLELRLGLRARTTRDVDALFRGDFEGFLTALDRALAEPVGELTFQRTEPAVIERASRLIKPRRLQVKVLLRGKTWRSVPVEVAADEGRAGQYVEPVPAPSLAHFGLATPSEIAGISTDYQVAQKLHASTDPHDPGGPGGHRNDRVRDVTDLHLLHRAFYDDADLPRLRGLRAACADLFDARAREARTAGAVERAWPPALTAHPHWQVDYPGYAEQVGLALTLQDAVAALNDWIAVVDAAG